MSNKSASYRFRSEVLLALHAAGFQAAHKAAEPKGVPHGDRRPHSSILGVPGLSIRTRNRQGLDLSGAVAEVQRAALAEGNDHFVSVQHAKGQDSVQDAYATTTLRCFLDLISRLPPPAA